MTKEQRKKLIIRRRIIISACLAVLLALILLIAFIISAVVGGDKKDNSSDTISEVSSVISSEEAVSSEQETVSVVSSIEAAGLDADFSKLLLVNGNNPLPEDYDYESNLVTIPDSYINGSLKQLDKDIWPYMKAMIDDARKEGVMLYVWSPYRSYSTQKMLFENKVKRCIENGTPADKAEAEAATVVARPGTSEHHTGLAADINMASDKFESTDMYRWLQENAENYGFIMRYKAEKKEITGVIHESWHYRFVGIKAAKEMNRLNMCLEEYTEYLKNRVS